MINDAYYPRVQDYVACRMMMMMINDAYYP